MVDKIMVNPIPMPSPDLVTYRFDQLDKGQAALHQKLNDLTSNFATREELAAVHQRLDNYTWYWRAVFTALLLASGGVVVDLIQRHHG